MNMFYVKNVLENIRRIKNMITNLCKDCNGTGEILTQGVILGRPFMKNGKFTYPYKPNGIWEKTICPCKSEEENDV